MEENPLDVIKILFRIFSFTFIPAFLSYLSTENNILDILKKNKIIDTSFDFSPFKQICLIISVIISSFVLVALFEFKNCQNRKLKAENIALVNDLKTSFLNALSIELSDLHARSIRIRIWREENNIFYKLKYLCFKLLKKNFIKKFIIKNIDGLSNNDSSLKGLYFYVQEPLLQGLVGKCYNDGTIIYEEDISELDELYNLNSFQSSRTRDAKFCLCNPIPNQKEKIVTIISLDCIYSIKIQNEQTETAVANMITIFVQNLNVYFPILFK